MSLSLYPRRIYFDGRAGCIRSDPFLHALHAPPELPGCVLRITEIDYAPGTIAQLREHGGRMRDMTPAERVACDALIASIRRAEEGGGRHG